MRTASFCVHLRTTVPGVVFISVIDLRWLDTVSQALIMCLKTNSPPLQLTKRLKFEVVDMAWRGNRSPLIRNCHVEISLNNFYGQSQETLDRFFSPLQDFLFGARPTTE